MAEIPYAALLRVAADVWVETAGRHAGDVVGTLDELIARGVLDIGPATVARAADQLADDGR